MQTTSMQKIGGQVIWHNTRILPQGDPMVFELDWHRTQGNVTGSATGRGCAHFLRVGGRDLVLRPFRRGGLIGKIIADRFLRLGAARSRAYQEYSLLEWMGAQGLSVPTPVAARYAPTGIWYRADLITEYIPQSRPLADVVLGQELPTSIWTQIGMMIRQMHDLGVYHSDLNCRNILLDADMHVWLIDFDKCRRRKPGQWQQQNLERLNRSLEKEARKQPSLCWNAADWSALLVGYDG